MKHVLREINPNNQQDVETITKMHLDLLPWGPLARLGRLFLQRFCYYVLVKDDVMRAALYEVNDQPAGFVAYTANSTTFHRTALKKHWPYVIYLALLSVIRNPLLISRVIKAVRLMISRSTEKNSGFCPLGEILAIGVRPEFRSPQFIYSTGLRISHELFKQVVSYFKSLGLSKMCLSVDSFNRPTLLFYHSLGGRFKHYKLAGDSKVQIWIDLESLYI